MELTTELVFELKVLEEVYKKQPRLFAESCYTRVKHHNEVRLLEYGGCGCAEVIIQGEESPYFVCAYCKRRCPWCFGCASEDPYLAECCDDCYCMLKAKWPNLIKCMEDMPYDYWKADSRDDEEGDEGPCSERAGSCHAGDS